MLLGGFGNPATLITMFGTFMNSLANTPFLCSPIMRGIIGAQNIPPMMCTDPKVTATGNPEKYVFLYFFHIKSNRTCQSVKWVLWSRIYFMRLFFVFGLGGYWNLFLFLLRNNRAGQPCTPGPWGLCPLIQDGSLNNWFAGDGVVDPLTAMTKNMFTANQGVQRMFDNVFSVQRKCGFCF